MPLAEVIYDFYDRLKSATKGYGTMDYDLIGFRPGDLVKLDILVNGDRVDALSVIVHRDHAEARGRKLLVRLKEEIDPPPLRDSAARPRSAARSSPARPSSPSARTSPPNATAATSPENASCWRSKKKARSA